jgi:hypothetical protein
VNAITRQLGFDPVALVQRMKAARVARISNVAVGKTKSELSSMRITYKKHGRPMPEYLEEK